ncbi:ATP-binding response regulator [Granulosicoccus sp. 3-233]|uniref:ATP-binding response regulator n=1 Tax=Granulosicoccus sp. 3-233 TaxID=3417969 RepID=UPI003D3359D0
MIPASFASTQSERKEKTSIKLLLVDDDPGYLDLCRRQLGKSASIDFLIETAASTNEAFQRCIATDYDCLLVDYQLPDGCGTDIVDRLNEWNEQQNDSARLPPPTIIVTAESGQHAPTQAIRAGAVDFIAKRNVTPHSLRRAITNAVERSRLELSVVQRNLALERAYSLLETANGQLESKRREILHFYHTVSHEVKTPLAAAREFISLIKDGAAGEVSPEQLVLLDHAMESCDQIRSQFTELLDLARIDNNKLQLRLSVVPVSTLIDRSLASIVETAREKQVAMVTTEYDTTTKIRCDADRIVQVLSNLLSNAVKFTPADGTVTLTFTDPAQGESVEFLVCDTGCGIAEEYVELIFERLYQVESEDETILRSGLGLGLSICRELLQLHNSQLKVSSEVGTGSCFSFELAR